MLEKTQFIQQQKEINSVDENGSTPLHWACYSGSYEAVNYLISLNVNINALDKEKFTPLHLAVSNNRETIVTKTGEVAIRGFVVDIFPLDSDKPIRIEFFGDTVESIREFDVDTQLTVNKLDSIQILPVSERLEGNYESIIE